MKAVIQRVQSAKVEVITRQLSNRSRITCLLGVENGDTPAYVQWLAEKSATCESSRMLQEK